MHAPSGSRCRDCGGSAGVARLLRRVCARGGLRGGTSVLAPGHVIFGTYQELVKSLSAWTERQWDNVWPRTAEFRFDLVNTMVMASTDGSMAVAIAPWTSTGFHEDGTPFDRPGRATIVLARQPDGRWLGVHSHMSLARGVPQDSHGKRAVKAP
jgi:SnoaL-like domain